MTQRQLINGCFIDLDSEGAFDHCFGGSHSVDGALCPNCIKPLMLHLTLDLRDPRLQFERTRIKLERLRLYYCMRCALSWQDFSYQIVDDESIRICEANHGPVTWMDWQKSGGGVDEFPPRPFTLTPIPARLQDLWNRISNLPRQGTLSPEEFADLKSLTASRAFPVATFNPDYYYVNQVGGRSLLCQGIPDPTCPHCSALTRKGAKMYFLACLYHDAGDHLRVAFKCTQIVFFLCPVCMSVKVVHRCD
jgi:hypothetical protein